jgi:multiple sugar transport system substrate-binding protein
MLITWVTGRIIITTIYLIKEELSMKKHIALLVAVILASTMFAACGVSPAQAAAPAGTVSLRFIDVSPGPVRQKYFEETFVKFEKETGIKVTYESVPWDDAANKLTVLGASGQLPDVMTTWAGWLGQYVPAGWVIPLDKYIDPMRGEFTDVVNNIIWKTEKELHGATYTVPDGLMVKGIYYRKDWAAELGINYGDKWTYYDYFDMVKSMYDAGKRRFGNSYRGARGAFDPLMVFLQTYTGGRTYDDEGNCLLNKPECVEAFKAWTNVYLEGYVPQDAINWGFVEMVDNFTGGLTGTLINDSEVAATCLESMKNDEWGVMPMPVSTVDGARLNTLNSPYSYTISGHSKNPDEAFKLIDYLTRPDNNIEYCKLTGLIPTKRAVGDDPLYGPDGPYAAFVKQLNDPALIVPTLFGPFDITDMHQGKLHEEVQRYLLGRQSAEDALNSIANELTKRMKAYMAENPDFKVETPKRVTE